METPPGQPSLKKQAAAHARGRELMIIMLLGFLIGLVFATFIGTVLWSFGYLTLGEGACPTDSTVCPATPAALPVCPTCEVLVVTATPMPTDTPTLTPTPDLQAMATAACQAFNQQFPGTPCPPLEPTATP